MSLDTTKLENVEHRRSRLITRCPACAEQGNDSKGEHLSIDEQGRFSCVIYPGDTGKEHRKRIFELTGIKNERGGSPSVSGNKTIKVRKATRSTRKVIKRDILGHLGRVNQTLKKQNENDINKDSIYIKEFDLSIPSVPS